SHYGDGSIELRWSSVSEMTKFETQIRSSMSSNWLCRASGIDRTLLVSLQDDQPRKQTYAYRRD
ncbi:hypothetical protein ACO1MZ_14480, partial [Staphylococcus aureus]